MNIIKVLTKVKLIIKTKKYIDYGDQKAFKLSQKELEKINALLPLIFKSLQPSYYCGIEKNVKYNSIESIIKTLTIDQINDLNKCNLKFVKYLVDRYNEGKYDVDEVIEKIVKVFKRKEFYF